MLKQQKGLLSRIMNRILLISMNNIFLNYFLIMIKKDGMIKKWKNNWQSYKYDDGKSLQENVGYSHLPEIQKAVDLSHIKFKSFINTYVKPGARILDIGCGTGLYLNDFESQYQIWGIDLNPFFIEKAKEVVPKASLLTGDYLKTKIDQKMDFIYSFGVFMYFDRSKVNLFFNKVYSDLNVKGYFYLQYSQATYLKDLFYPDLSYIKYSPFFLEKRIDKTKFKIISHSHFFDDRQVKFFDKKRYYFPDGTKKRVDTIMNTYLLVLQKI